MTKYSINDGSFYITNVCNLTCNYCESFNNFAFKGHFYWKDYEEVFQKWGDILYIDILNIHGGEPITNPDIINWAIGLKKIWRESSEYFISSNGTLLKNKIDECRELINLGWNFDIVIHDPEHREEVENSIRTILKNKNYKINYDVDIIKNRKEYVDVDGTLLISIEEAFVFRQNSIASMKDRMINMHRSNIDKAHEICFNDADEQCYGFFRGALYKCYLTGIAQDLVKQFNVEPYAKDLLLSYKPGWPYDDDQTLDHFFANLHKPLAQCTLCPDKEICSSIHPMPKKKPKI